MSFTDQLKELREKTGASISDIKRALEESEGNLEQALRLIEHKLGGVAAKKSTRETNAGLVDAYIHSNGKIGALVALYCETDFVARNPSFKELVHNLSMHVAAMNPLYLSLDVVPDEMWQAERGRFAEEAQAMDKPVHIIGEIIEGKLKAHFTPLSFLAQPFIKDQDKTVGEVINEAIGRFGENIKIGKFIRFEL